MCLPKEQYPIVILPRRSYKKKLSIDRLLRRYHDLMVVRQVKGLETDCWLITEGGDRVLQDSVFESSMANLSLNLAGGLFDTRRDAHLRFLPTSNEAKAQWNGGKVSYEIVSSADSYSFDESCFGLCFLVREIHNRTFPFFKHFETQAERDKFERQAYKATSAKEKRYDAHLVEAFENKKSNVLVRPRIKLHHAPNNANYWHITLDTYRPIDKEYVSPEERLNSSDKRMFKALKQDLKQHCSIDTDPNYTLSRFSYLRWPFWLIFSFD